MSDERNWAQRADEVVDRVFYALTDWLAPEPEIDPEYAAQLAALEEEEQEEGNEQ